VAALVAGTGIAIVVTQSLRDEGPVATSIHWKKRPGPRYRACFRLTRTDRVEVSVVDSGDQVARVLTPGEELAGGDAAHCFDWDGRTAAGHPVPPGLYHLRLDLRDADRIAVSGERLRIPQPGTAS
jgi:flagellar hook capping protein FlgD